MGCCCRKQYEQDSDIQNDLTLSRTEINKNSDSYREEGRRYFNRRQYQQARRAYQLALSKDPHSVYNYTNLALVYKAQAQYRAAIETITNMQNMFQGHTNSEIRVMMAKGAIIKAKCQISHVKNLLQSQENLSIKQFQESQSYIEKAITTLETLDFSEDPQIKRMNPGQYIVATKNMNSILTGKKSSKTASDLLLSYLSNRMKSKQAQNKFESLEVKKYFKDPKNVMEKVSEWKKEKEVDHFKLLKQEDFMTDPILYEPFQNPIITKSGITYEESVLKSHYSKNGSSDPITRQELLGQLGVRNKTLLAYMKQVNYHSLNVPNL